MYYRYYIYYTILYSILYYILYTIYKLAFHNIEENRENHKQVQWNSVLNFGVRLKSKKDHKNNQILLFPPSLLALVVVASENF